MPRVPTAEGFGVLPGVRQGQARPVLSMEEAALPGRQMIQAGQQATELGRAYGEYALQEQAKVNKARLNDAYNQGQLLQQDLAKRMGELKGAAAAKGINGRPIGEYFAEELNKGLSGIAQDLGNDVLKQDFALLADDMVTRFRGQSMAYEAEQSAIYQKNVRDTTAVTAFNVISEDPFSPGVVEFNLARARDAYTETFREAGFDESSGLEEQVKGAMGKSHSVVIDTLLEQGRGMDAKAYFEKHRNDFNAADAEMVEAKVSKGSSAAQALVDVDAVLGEFTIRGDNIPRAKMDARLREIVGDDPVRLNAARDELTVRMALYEEQYRNQYADNYDAALRAAQSSPARAYASPAFNSLDAKDQEAIRSFVTGKADKARQDEQDRRFYDLAFGDPAVIATMPEGNFRFLRSSVGEDNFLRLQKMRADMRQDPAKIIDVTLDNDQFNVLATEFGYNVTDNADKAQVSQLRVAMDDAIDLEQQRLNRKLNRQEKEAVIRQAFSTKVKVKDGWWWDTEVAAPLLTPEQMQNVVIPNADRQQIAAAMQVYYERTGSLLYAPTEDNVRRIYLQRSGVRAPE